MKREEDFSIDDFRPEVEGNGIGDAGDIIFLILYFLALGGICVLFF